MRISDWSSDVCSSDLLPLMAQSGLIFRPPHWRARLSGGWEKDNVSITAIGSYIGPVRDDRFQPITSVPAFVTVDTVLHLTTDRNSGLLGGLGFTVSIQNIFNEKIGRASCREEVCQYG